MGLSRWAEVCFDTEMDLHVSGDEPATTAGFQVWRLRNAGDSEKAFVERRCVCLSPWRHRELYVVDSTYCHLPSMSCLRAEGSCDQER